MPRVIVAPDKFKGSLAAAEVAEHIAAGLRAAVPGVDVRTAPVADGGDGTVAAAVAAGYESVPVRAAGPTGRAGTAHYARRGATAVVELAGVCGLGRLPGGVLEPLHASSYGVGEAIAAALDAGARQVLLGIGGSASTDGGTGMLQALGAQILDAAGGPVQRGGGALAHVARLHLDRLHPALRGAQLTVACDVDNPLYGPDGAAAVYAPQKGADAVQVAELDAGLRHWAQIAARTTGTDRAGAPGAGAAGGVGFAALLLGARLRPGIELMLEMLEFETILRGADLVITGEGSLDAQTLAGKAPAGVAAAAGRAGVPVVAVAGQVALDAETLAAAGIAGSYALREFEPDLARCLAEPGPVLQRAAAALARDWLHAADLTPADPDRAVPRPRPTL